MTTEYVACLERALLAYEEVKKAEHLFSDEQKEWADRGIDRLNAEIAAYKDPTDDH